jgi:hypothetical protein
MISNALLMLSGAVLVLLAGREVVVTFQTSSFRVRWSQKRIRRKHHPVMFWVNSVALLLACAGGIFLISWGVIATPPSR